nr:MAG TPA: hypothetical protein [Caudoviricetes sp.]
MHLPSQLLALRQPVITVYQQYANLSRDFSKNVDRTPT